MAVRQLRLLFGKKKSINQQIRNENKDRCDKAAMVPMEVELSYLFETIRTPKERARPKGSLGNKKPHRCTVARAHPGGRKSCGGKDPQFRAKAV